MYVYNSNVDVFISKHYHQIFHHDFEELEIVYSLHKLVSSFIIFSFLAAAMVAALLTLVPVGSSEGLCFFRYLTMSQIVNSNNTISITAK